MVDVTIPRIGESINTVFISRWIKKVGDAVAAGEGILELDSDKASMEVPSPTSGVLSERLVSEGDEVAIGALVARIDEAGRVAAAPVAAAPVAAAPEAPKGEVRAGPAARRDAGEKGVDLGHVTGTGPRGRVTTTDVARAELAEKPQPAAKAEAPPAPAVPVTAPGAPEGRFERVPMTPMRRTIARRLVQAQSEAAMLTTFNEVDMSRILELRKRYQDNFTKRYGIKLGFMSFFVKAAIEALKEFPAVNASIDGNDILYKHFYHVGVAVSGPKGLVVPVIRDADRLSFAQTEQAIADLAVKAKDNKLKLEDFQDGTFTISNGGIFGSLMSTPILNPPQVGILGMHKIQERPIGVDGQIVLRPMMYLAMSYDHRIIDGREAVGFLVRIKECVEDPERILLET